MLLALDTATQTMSLALHDGEALLAEQTWHSGNKHNQLLANAIQTMFAACDIGLDALTVLAVSTGPGSYTGLRVGVALAKGMAAVRDLPLVGVSSLDTLAAAHPFQNTRHHLLVVVQAGRGRIVAGRYRVKKGRWVPYADPRLTTWEELLAGLEGSFFVTGEVDAAGRSALEAARTDARALTLVNPAQRLRRAGFLAQEAWRRYHEGSPTDFAPARLLPLYLKTDGVPERPG